MKRLTYFFFAVGLLFFLSSSTIEAQVATGCYALKNKSTNEYMTHNGWGSIEYYANRPEAQGWEKFYITKLSNGHYTIYDTDGNFLSAQPSLNPGVGYIHKKSEARGWEYWTIEVSNEITAKAHNGKLITIDFKYNTKRVMLMDEGIEGLDERHYSWTIEPSSGCKVPPAH